MSMHPKLSTSAFKGPVARERLLPQPMTLLNGREQRASKPRLHERPPARLELPLESTFRLVPGVENGAVYLL